MNDTYKPITTPRHRCQGLEKSTSAKGCVHIAQKHP